MSNFRVKTFVLLLGAAASLATYACNAPAKPASGADSAQAARTRTRAVHDSVQALLDEFTSKMNSGDLEAVGKLYSNDSAFYWIESSVVRYRSADEVRKALLSLKSIPQIEMKFYSTDIDVLAPNIAIVRTEFSQGFLDARGMGDTYGGFMTITVVRDADGWRFRNGHTSSRRPRPGT